MIRLAICGTDEQGPRRVAARLRGAELSTLEECDAIVAEWWPAGIETAEKSLLSGRHVLLPADACRSLEALDRVVAAAQRTSTGHLE